MANKVVLWIHSSNSWKTGPKFKAAFSRQALKSDDEKEKEQEEDDITVGKFQVEDLEGWQVLFLPHLYADHLLFMRTFEEEDEAMEYCQAQFELHCGCGIFVHTGYTASYHHTGKRVNMDPARLSRYSNEVPRKADGGSALITVNTKLKLVSVDSLASDSVWNV